MGGGETRHECCVETTSMTPTVAPVLALRESHEC